MQGFKEQLKNEIPEFLALGQAYQRKDISMMEFKHESGGMGVYAQRGGELFMIRLRILSGVLELEQFKLIYAYAKRYGLKRMHFTTRQTIQLHDLTIEQVCELMAEAIDEGIYTRGGGGNYPRNVSLSPLAGVAVDEVFDPTPFALLVNEHFLSKITTYHLPRKLKVSFSNNELDTGNATIADLGFLAVKDGEEPYFKMYLCGGLGNNPSLSIEYPRLIKPEEVLYHVEAMTKFFMEEGDYANRAKARTRYIAMRMSREELLSKYDGFLKEVQDNMSLKELQATLASHENTMIMEKDELGILPQRQKDRYTVIIHPTGGQLELSDCEQLIDFFAKVEGIELRLDLDESLYVRNLSYEQAKELLALSKGYNPQVPIQCSISCIGVPTCQIGIAETQKALRAMLKYLYKKEVTLDRLPIVHFSGCNNSCGRHQVSELGFVGRKKKVNGELMDAYEVVAGGCLGKDKTRLASSLGTISVTKIPEFMEALLLKLEEREIPFSEFYQEDVFQQVVDEFSI